MDCGVSLTLLCGVKGMSSANADMLLGALKWALILVGVAIIVLTLTYVAPEGADRYVYTYENGTVLTGEPAVPPTMTDTAFDYLLGIGIGLVMIAVGAVVFCLRRIGSYLGNAVEEMRHVRSGES